MEKDEWHLRLTHLNDWTSHNPPQNSDYEKIKLDKCKKLKSAIAVYFKQATSGCHNILKQKNNTKKSRGQAATWAALDGMLLLSNLRQFSLTCITGEGQSLNEGQPIHFVCYRSCYHTADTEMKNCWMSIPHDCDAEKHQKTLNI